jgi:hypothetical protein
MKIKLITLSVFLALSAYSNAQSYTQCYDIGNGMQNCVQITTSATTSTTGSTTTSSTTSSGTTTATASSFGNGLITEDIIIATIQEQLLEIQNSSNSSSLLTQYLATTPYTAAQIAEATGYSISQVTTLISNAKTSFANGTYLALNQEPTPSIAPFKPEVLYTNENHVSTKPAFVVGGSVVQQQLPTELKMPKQTEGYPVESLINVASKPLATSTSNVTTPTFTVGGGSSINTSSGTSSNATTNAITIPVGAPATASTTAAIQSDMSKLQGGNQMDLYKYLATTNYSAAQLSAATGYSVADVQKVMSNANIAMSTYNNTALNIMTGNGNNLTDTSANLANYNAAQVANAASTVNTSHNQTLAAGAAANAQAMATASQTAFQNYATQQALNSVNNGSTNSSATYAPTVTETIQAQAAALQSGGGGQAALNAYLATTSFTAEQISAATGYNATDLQNAINNAKQATILDTKAQ